MIVGGPRFDGDESLSARREQHDAYGAALSILVRGCNRHFANAAALLQVAPTLSVVTFDDRMLQEAHDTLAAVWRHRCSVAQPPLPSLGLDAVGWLGWLEAEVTRWHDYPHLARLTLQAATDAAAGTMLAQALRAHYDDVPWSGDDRPAHIPG